MEEVVAGIDIGGTNTTIGLVSKAGRVLAKDGLKTKHFPEIADFVIAANEIINKQIENLRQDSPELTLKPEEKNLK